MIFRSDIVWHFQLVEPSGTLFVGIGEVFGSDQCLFYYSVVPCLIAGVFINLMEMVVVVEKHDDCHFAYQLALIWLLWWIQFESLRRKLETVLGSMSNRKWFRRPALIEYSKKLWILF